MSTKKETSKTAGNWPTPIDELFTKLGLPLTTGQKTGTSVRPVKKHQPFGCKWMRYKSDKLQRLKIED